MSETTTTASSFAPHTFVTSAISFSAPHIINALLAAGHCVTAAVRQNSTIHDLITHHPEWKGKVNYVVVYEKERTNEGIMGRTLETEEFDHAVVILPTTATNSELDDTGFLNDDKSSFLSFLHSALKHAPTLKSLVIVGPSQFSFSTTSHPHPAHPPAYNENLTLPTIVSAIQSLFMTGSVSSTPGFSISHLVPGLMTGPPLQDVRGKSDLDAASRLVLDCVDVYGDGLGPEEGEKRWKRWIDVRDLATATVRALSRAENEGIAVGRVEEIGSAEIRKILGSLGEDVLGALKWKGMKMLLEEEDEDERIGRRFKGVEFRKPGFGVDDGDEEPTMSEDDLEDGNAALGFGKGGEGLRGLEESVKDTVQKLLEIKTRFGFDE
ncbi:hypothetical protein K402DRAFT_393400 [Aulographum hederae CBS 113979]|uniref:NAD(P)-binding protein n=1 Tax=Aulographum hederae CBS 113979 TaxID=1176131 RepID=A0A6G1H153_9PEZI|nr:hypothetical protein K402DRAFT_393400 [Aulographum hederae CBS 113979]